MQRNLQLLVRLPTADILSIEVLALESTKVCDILNTIRAEAPTCLSGCSETHMRFVCKGKELPSNSCILDHKLDSGSTIEIIIKMSADLYVHEDVEYSSFIVSIIPHEGRMDVSLETNIEVQFGPSRSGLCLYTPALLDVEALKTTSVHDGNMLSELGQREATEKGYKNPWTEYKYNNRLMLLELDAVDEGSPKDSLEVLRYNWCAINGGYTEGDTPSWQRYTRHMPVDCILKETKIDDGEVAISMKPFNALKHDTYYAVFLGNNIPTVPVCELEAPLYGYMGPGTCEDHLHIFKTISREEEEERIRIAAIRNRRSSKSVKSGKMSRKKSSVVAAEA